MRVLSSKCLSIHSRFYFLNPKINFYELDNSWLHRNSSTAKPIIHSNEIKVEDIRNIGISAHIDSGKTTLTERILYYTGRIKEMHEVKGKDRIGAVMDFMDLERERGITIQSAATFAWWKNYNINVIDTPGHVDFTMEVERALRVLDSAILVICAVGGVQSQTYTVNRQIKRYGVPFIGFINKLDRSLADPIKALEQIREKLQQNAAFVQIPIGIKNDFTGLIDIVDMKALYFEGKHGSLVVEKDIPEDKLEDAELYRSDLIESLANVDAKIGEMFVSEKMPSNQELHDAIRRNVIDRKFTPYFLGSALKNKGIQTLLDGVVKYLPNPSEIKNYAYLPDCDKKDRILLNPERTTKHPSVCLSFKLETRPDGQLSFMRMYQGSISKGDLLLNTKTSERFKVPKLARVHAQDVEIVDRVYAGDIFAMLGADTFSGETYVSTNSTPVSLEPFYVPEPVISISIEAANAAEIDKLMKALNRFTKEDPTLKFTVDSETREAILSGMGELHLDIYVNRIRREYDCNLKVGQPKVAYRETLTRRVEFDYRHKKQTGGAGQFAHIVGYIEPLPVEQQLEVEFIDKSEHSCVPKQFVPAIRKGFFEICDRGVVSGNKITGVRFVLLDGSFHIVDSNEIAFRTAGMSATREVFNDKYTTIMEPWMKIEIISPVQHQSAVLALLTSRNGCISDADTVDDISIVKGQVSLKNMFAFNTYLMQVTHGKGEFSMEFEVFAAASSELQNEIRSRYII